MGTGVLFAVEPLLVERIRRMEMSERPKYISEVLDDLYFEEYPERTCELEESWEAIHRALTGGSFLFDSDEPLAVAVLGGEVLYFDGEAYDDYIISAKTPEETAFIADALEKLSDKEFRSGYEKISAEEYPDKSREDLEDALEYFRDSTAFWRFAAKNKLAVLFTAEL